MSTPHKWGTEGVEMTPKYGTEGVKVWNWGGESMELRGWYPFSSPPIASTYDPYFPSLPSHPPYGGVAVGRTGPSTLNRLTTDNRAGGVECAAYPDKREAVGQLYRRHPLKGAPRLPALGQGVSINGAFRRRKMGVC